VTNWSRSSSPIDIPPTLGPAAEVGQGDTGECGSHVGDVDHMPRPLKYSVLKIQGLASGFIPRMRNASVSKRYSQTPSGAPNHPATLLGAAEQQFKSIGKLDLTTHLKTCAASGVVHDSAIYDGKFRTNDEFGHIGNSARGLNACKPSRMHHRPLSVT
jgi:hypothetical protein